MSQECLFECDEFFSGKSETWKLFEALRLCMMAVYPQTRLRVMKTCIAFDDPKPYAYVSFPPRKSMPGLWLSISLRTAQTHPRFAMVVPVSASRYTAHIHLPDERAIDGELLALIETAHR